MSVACPLTPAFSFFAQRVERTATDATIDDRGGTTRLYEAMEAAAGHLEAFRRSHPECTLRILALTDGEDTSGKSALPVRTDRIRRLRQPQSADRPCLIRHVVLSPSPFLFLLPCAAYLS